MKKYLPSLLILIALPLFAKADWMTGLNIAGTYGLPNAFVYDIFDNLLLFLLAIFTILAVISFVINGIMFLMAGSSQDMAERAKRGVTLSIIGVAIGISGYIIITFIDSILLGWPE